MALSKSAASQIAEQIEEIFSKKPITESEPSLAHLRDRFTVRINVPAIQSHQLVKLAEIEKTFGYVTMMRSGTGISIRFS